MRAASFCLPSGLRLPEVPKSGKLGSYDNAGLIEAASTGVKRDSNTAMAPEDCQNGDMATVPTEKGAWQSCCLSVSLTVAKLNSLNKRHRKATIEAQGENRHGQVANWKNEIAKWEVG